MKAFQIAAIVATIVNAPLTSDLFAPATVGPARTRTSALARLRLGLRRWPRQVKRLVDAWVAARLARRERQAAAWASDHLGGASVRPSRTVPGRLR